MSRSFWAGQGGPFDTTQPAQYHLSDFPDDCKHNLIYAVHHKEVQQNLYCNHRRIKAIRYYCLAFIWVIGPEYLLLSRKSSTYLSCCVSLPPAELSYSWRIQVQCSQWTKHKTIIQTRTELHTVMMPCKHDFFFCCGGGAVCFLCTFSKVLVGAGAARKKKCKRVAVAFAGHPHLP